MGRLIDKLQAKALELVPNLIGDSADVIVHLPVIDAILSDLDEILADGFQWHEVDDVFAALAHPLMEIAGKMSDKSGAEKKAFVVDAITVVYFHYNPNLPLVPEAFGFETRLEKYLVPKFAGIAVESAYRLGKKVREKLAKE